MKIGVIGGGVVGKATARCFIEHVDDVLIWDKVQERTTAPLGQVLDCDLILICLPETVVEEFLSQGLELMHKDANLVLRSTVPVGTTKRLAEDFKLPNLVHWPEFLTARCSLTDAQIPARNVIGWPNADASELAIKLRDLLFKRFPGVRVHGMASDESEAVKLMTNAFFAVKVAFFNEAFQFCEDQLLDWDRVLAAVLADGRIAHSHTRVPGPDGHYGFGGACLPKDLKQWIDCILASGQLATVARAAQDRNIEDRKRPVSQLEKDFLT